jgi:hypothetical protein
MLKRKTEPNRSLERTNDTTAAAGHRRESRSSPKRDEGRDALAEGRRGERLTPGGEPLTLAELVERLPDTLPPYDTFPPHTPYKARIEILFGLSTANLKLFAGRRGRG